MPRIEISGELVEIMDCPDCGRTIISENMAACGFITKCGKRLINLKECGVAICPPDAKWSISAYRPLTPCMG